MCCYLLIWWIKHSNSKFNTVMGTGQGCVLSRKAYSTPHIQRQDQTTLRPRLPKFVLEFKASPWRPHPIPISLRPRLQTRAKATPLWGQGQTCSKPRPKPGHFETKTTKICSRVRGTFWRTPSLMRGDIILCDIQLHKISVDIYIISLIRKKQISLSLYPA